MVPESAMRNPDWTGHVHDARSTSRLGLLRRPIWLLTGGIALLLLLAFGLLVYSSWQHARALDPLQHHLDFLAQAESADNLLRELVARAAQGETDPSLVQYVEGRLAALRRSGYQLDARSAGLMAQVDNALRASGEAGRDGLLNARLAMRRMLAAEMAAHKALLLDRQATAQREQRIALGLLVGLLMVSIPLGLRIRHNVIMPLETLGRLMTLMSRHDYTSAPTADGLIEGNKAA